MRLLLTTLAAALVLIMVITMARIWGLGQSFAEFKHPFLEGSHPLVIVKAGNAAAVKAAPASSIVWLDVRTSKDEVLFVLPSGSENEFLKDLIERQKQNPSQKILEGSKISDYNWSQISAFYPQAPQLSQIYQDFPAQKFVLNVIDNVMNVDQMVVKTLKPFNPDERTFIQSDTLVVMTSIKDSKPEWVYGTSQADLMRFMTFDSMWILPSTQYKGDVFVAPFKIMNRPAFNPNVLEEMRRRHKKIFLGPIRTQEEFAQAQSVNADGLITENYSELKSWLDQSQKH